MEIQLLREGVRAPERGTRLSAGYDIFMPEAGIAGNAHGAVKVALGFATAIPPGYAALLLPRSGVGSKHGVELHNTCGVIDADYRGEWFATVSVKQGKSFKWNAGDRILQFLLVPVFTPALEVVANLNLTERGTGGLGSTGA